jgi:hypothetical protein
LNGWSWKPTTPGYYQVTFSFVNKNGTEEVLSRPVTIRAKDRISHVFLREEQGFGVLPASKPFEKVIGQFGFTYSNNPVEADLAKLIGFDLVRLLCDWGASFTNLHKGIESVKGHYNWQIFDRKVDVFANSGFVLNTQFCYTPLWASPFPEKTNINICTVEGTTYAPKDMNDFSRFVEAAVARYKDRISLWLFHYQTHRLFFRRYIKIPKEYFHRQNESLRYLLNATRPELWMAPYSKLEDLPNVLWSFFEQHFQHLLILPIVQFYLYLLRQQGIPCKYLHQRIAGKY